MTPQWNHSFFMFITNERGAGEYDVPQCAPGTPVDQCKHGVGGGKPPPTPHPPPPLLVIYGKKFQKKKLGN